MSSTEAYRELLSRPAATPALTSRDYRAASARRVYEILAARKADKAFLASFE